MTKVNSLLRAGSAIAAIMTASSPTYAQDGQDQSTVSESDQVSASDGQEESDEIIVTAQKRPERLIDAAQSIAVLTGESLVKADSKQFRDFANKIPGVSFSSSGAGESQIVIRGVTTGFDNTPTVSVYVDDVPYGSSGSFAKGSAHALDLGLFDIERIEVLRGPQGTIYGASSIGGLVKYVSKAPDLSELSGDARFGAAMTAGGAPSYNGAATINLPIQTDKIALRANAYYSREGGYIDNVALGDKNVNGSRVYGGRLDLLLNPSDDLTLRIVGLAQNISRGGLATADYTLAGAPVFGSLVQSRAIAEPFEQRLRLVSGTLTYDMGFASFTSVTSYQDTKTAFTYDVTNILGGIVPFFYQGPYTSVPYLNSQRVKKFVQEVRLASPSGQPLEWLIGGFYTRERTLKFDNFGAYNQSTNVFDFLRTFRPSTYREAAAFGHLTYHITSAFEISGGIRFSQNRQALKPGTASGAFVGAPPTLTAYSKESVVTYLADGKYHFGKNATAYIRFATGYRPGAPTSPIVIIDPVSNLPIPSQTKADTVKSYDAGFKGQTADRTFSYDLNVYRIDWRDIPVLGKSASGLNFQTNGGKARNYGAELTLTARPAPGVTISGAFGYQRTRVLNDINVVGALKGDSLPNVPKFTAALDSEYQISRDGVRPTIGAALRFVDTRAGSFPNDASTANYKLPDYTLVDLRLGLTLFESDVQFYVRNIFNERPQLLDAAGLSAPAGPVHISTLQPRSFGVSINRHF